MHRKSRPPRNPTHAQLEIRIALLEASSRGEIDNPDATVDLLAGAIEEIESTARSELEELHDEVARKQAEFDAARAQWEAERKGLHKLREQADRDAVAITNTPQVGPLEDPHGYYVYFLWSHTNDLLYVGMSRNVLSRLGEHVRQRGYAIYRITVVQCPDEASMERTKARAIAQHKPEWNTVGVGVEVRA